MTTPSSEIEPVASHPPVPLAEVLAAERALWRTAAIWSVFAVPVCVGLWVGIVALALASSKQGLVVPLSVAAGIGVIAGVFFGGLGAFVVRAHGLDEIDRRAQRH
jgi:hypothetical protein